MGGGYLWLILLFALKNPKNSKSTTRHIPPQFHQPPERHQQGQIPNECILSEEWKSFPAAPAAARSTGDNRYVMSLHPPMSISGIGFEIAARIQGLLL